MEDSGIFNSMIIMTIVTFEANLKQMKELMDDAKSPKMVAYLQKRTVRKLMWLTNSEQGKEL